MRDFSSLPLDLFIRLDEVCNAFEREWKSGGRPLLEGVLSQNADLDRSALLGPLIELEVYYRRKRGEQPTPQEYHTRLPGSDEVIAGIFDETPTVPGPNGPGGPPLPAPPAPRRLRHDDPPGYELLAELGDGGTGVVYLAHERAADRRVALKMLHSPGGYKAVERLLVEVRAMARLDHPNVVKVITVEMNQGTPFFTMEYVPGGTLAALAKGTEGRALLPPADAARLVLQAADGVAHAHAHGIIHRDLKPSNILLAGLAPLDEPDSEPMTPSCTPLEEQSTLADVEGDETPESEVRQRPLPRLAGCTAKVSDFGLAKRIDQPDGVTTIPAIMGTPAYMSPEMASEQILDGAAGKRADVYGLGATLYHLLSGRPPFVDDRPGEHARRSRHQEIMDRVVHTEPTRPRALRPEIPADLEGIVVKAMEKNPAKRYPSAEAFADDLRKFLAGEAPSAPPLTRRRRALRWLKRNRARVALMTATAAIVLLAVGLIAGLREGPALNPVEQYQKELKAGKPVTLIHEKGPPKWHRWAFGPTALGESTTGDGSYYFESIRHALLELLPDPGIERYKVTVDLRFLWDKPPIPLRAETPKHEGSNYTRTGLYFGHTAHVAANGLPAHSFVAVAFNDSPLSAELQKKGIRRFAQANANVILVHPIGLQEHSRIDMSRPIRLPPREGLPGDWHRLHLEVTPEDVRILWATDPAAEPELLAALTAAEIDRDLAKSNTNLLKNNPGSEIMLPAWRPRMPLGIWSQGAAVAIRNVFVEPLP